MKVCTGLDKSEERPSHMSYDLLLFESEPNTDPQAAVEEIFSAFLDYKREREGINFLIPTEGPSYGTIQPSSAWRIRQIAKALTQHDPKLVIAPPFQYAESAAEFLQRWGITKEEARRRYRTLELSAPDQGTGIFIYLDYYLKNTTIMMGIPYWHSDKAAIYALRDAWNYLRVLQGQTNYCMYDPQQEKFLNLEEDFEAVLEAYGRRVREAQQRFGDASEWRRNILGVTPIEAH